jgi:hypothetical protein
MQPHPVSGLPDCVCVWEFAFLFMDNKNAHQRLDGHRDHLIFGNWLA